MLKLRSLKIHMEMLNSNSPIKRKPIKDAIYLVIIVLLAALCAQFYYSYRYQPEQERSVRIYYNQQTEANKQVVQTIQYANQFVYFAIYTFTRDDIKDALLGAKHRGLDVRGVVDRDQTNKIESQNKIVKELAAAGIPI